VAKIQYKIALSLAILVLRRSVMYGNQFVDPEIIDLCHSEVDFDSKYWQKIKDNEQVEQKNQKLMRMYSYFNH
jgi:hypothetical protein